MVVPALGAAKTATLVKEDAIYRLAYSCGHHSSYTRLVTPSFLRLLTFACRGGAALAWRGGGALLLKTLPHGAERRSMLVPTTPCLLRTARRRQRNMPPAARVAWHRKLAVVAEPVLRCGTAELPL